MLQAALIIPTLLLGAVTRDEEEFITELHPLIMKDTMDAPPSN